MKYAAQQTTNNNNYNIAFNIIITTTNTIGLFCLSCSHDLSPSVVHNRTHWTQLILYFSI